MPDSDSKAVTKGPGRHILTLPPPPSDLTEFQPRKIPITLPDFYMNDMILHET
jgi:hypothetical protein